MVKLSNCSYISSFKPLMFIKPQKLFLATLPASSDSSSSTDDSDILISRHFLPWALDFMCLVRFPLTKGYSQLHRKQKSHLFVTRTQTQRNCAYKGVMRCDFKCCFLFQAVCTYERSLKLQRLKYQTQRDILNKS